MERRSIWALLASRPPSPGAPDVLGAVAAALDPGRFRPRLAPDVELKEFELRWGGRYAMLGNPRDQIYYRLDPEDVELLRLMDGTRTVSEIVVERFQEEGDLHLSGVADLVELLRQEGFLDRRPVRVDHALRRALEPGSRFTRAARQALRSLSIEWRGADRLVRWLHGHGLARLYHPLAVAAMAVLSTAGLVAFAAVHRSGRFALAGTSPVAESLALLALGYVLTFLHELGHALTLVHFGRRVKSAGFMLYFGSPAFFVDASEGLMLERGQRILQAFGGPFAELVAAGSAALVVWAFPEGPLAPTLYRFCVLNYFVLFMNLVPFLELDGYWIASDLIQVPDLRQRSLAFLREDLLRKLRARERFDRGEVGLLAYGLAGIAFTVFSVWTAAFFWWVIFGGLVTALWRGGPLGRTLLLALALFVGGPAIRGAIRGARALLRRARSVARRVRFRLETRWRVEAAELIDGLELFGGLDEESLSDLAGRVRLRTVPPGRAVVRQGERADALYVVRRGVLQVVEELGGGRERVIRTLGRGESFGELGLIEAAPRSATVRASSEAELFEVDRGTFERLLAERARLPAFLPTAQAIEELRALPCFSHLEVDELGALARSGRWLLVAPGTELVRQGEEGDAFYAVGSGRFEVLEDGVRVRELGAGSHFGEIALLRDVPRTATVRALTPARVFRLEREGFHRLVAGAFARGTLRPAPEAAGPWQH
ncbi:MAG TPA: cyclic nucleotide-binding domain-containing protein [Actinomycetota bacterium]|nr:cyclic nucleotide-binding domain-containing protein [Actinomycetota bacterium]